MNENFRSFDSPESATDPDAWSPQFQIYALQRVIAGCQRLGDLSCVLELGPMLERFSGRGFHLLSALLDLNVEWNPNWGLEDGLNQLPKDALRMWGEISRSIPGPEQEIRDILRKARGEAPAELEIRPVVLHSIDDLPPTPPTVWRIPDFLPEVGFGMFFGFPGVGKTIFCMDLAIRIACGDASLLGQPCDPCPVLFLEEEGGKEVFLRRWRLLAGNRKLQFPLVLLYGDLQFNDKRTLEGLKRIIYDFGIRVFFFDPLSLVAGVDENDNNAIISFTQKCILPFVDMGCLVIAIHHPNKGNPNAPDDGTLPLNRACGGSSWGRFLDFAYSVVGNCSESCYIHVEKHRNEPLSSVHWRLRNLGQMDDGHLIVERCISQKISDGAEKVMALLEEHGALPISRISTELKRSTKYTRELLGEMCQLPDHPIEQIQEGSTWKYRIRMGGNGGNVENGSDVPF